MTEVSRILVVGGGLAGAKTVEALREQGFDGALTLVGGEEHVPYERPPLSKGYLLGNELLDKVWVHPRAWYTDHDVHLCVGTRAQAIDRGSRRVELDNGEHRDYDALVLATGSTVRRLNVPGSDLPGVLSLRSLDDSNRLRTRLAAGERLVIVGGGWIGLEVAAAAREQQMDVTVLEASALPLGRVLGEQMAGFFADLHRAHGVDLRTGAAVSGFSGKDGLVAGVRLRDGTMIQADTVLAAVGITPAVELAAAAGLEVDNGVLVDAHLRTSDPAIWAVGDLANAWHPLLQRRLRVEHWANALHQPAVAAASILGRDASYDRLPYFYTDQYDVGMEYVGHAEEGSYDDVVVRGELGTREFIAFWLSSGRVLAGMTVNVWDMVEPIRVLITGGHRVDPARLADPQVPLSDVKEPVHHASSRSPYPR